MGELLQLLIAGEAQGQDQRAGVGTEKESTPQHGAKKRAAARSAPATEEVIDLS